VWPDAVSSLDGGAALERVVEEDVHIVAVVVQPLWRLEVGALLGGPDSAVAFGRAFGHRKRPLLSA
jgi:hypothetical protein